MTVGVTPPRAPDTGNAPAHPLQTQPKARVKDKSRWQGRNCAEIAWIARMPAVSPRLSVGDRLHGGDDRGFGRLLVETEGCQRSLATFLFDQRQQDVLGADVVVP